MQVGRPLVASLTRPVVFETLRGVSTYRQTFKRQREKANLDVGLPETVDEFRFPREERGLDYELNFSCNRDGLTPSAACYRNLGLRGSLSLAQGKLDAQKALHVTSKTPEFQLVASTLDKSFSSSDFAAIQKAFRSHFHESTALFIHDGVFGSANPVRVRVITDNPNLAHLLHHLVEPVSLQSPMKHENDVVIHFASRFNPAAAPAGTGVPNKPFCVSNERFVLAAGTDSLSSVLDALSFAAAGKFAGKGSLSLNGFLADNTLLLSHENLFSAGKLDLAQTQVANQVGLTKAGVARIFAGAVVPSALRPSQFGDYVEAPSGLTISKLPTTTTLHPLPRRLVFVLNETSGALKSQKLESKDALFQFALGYAGSGKPKAFFVNHRSPAATPAQLVVNFKQFLEAAKPELYLVNLKTDPNLSTLLPKLASLPARTAAYDETVASFEKSRGTEVAAAKAVLAEQK